MKKKSKITNKHATPVRLNQNCYAKISKLEYRPEIDGLRAIAVLSVIIYHMEISLGSNFLLSGGFIGVDIFFVISGFLITSIIIDETKKTGNFSFFNFYERRIRRLIPALLIVVFVSFFFGWYILLPEQFVDFSKSSIATLLFGSNFYWEKTLQEYGAESSLIKPLLHTWTLAVEEQFYLIFPVVFFIIYRYIKQRVTIILFILMLLSLQLSYYLTARNPSLSFYMLQSRLWEFLAGGWLAHMSYSCTTTRKMKILKTLSEQMPLCGLALIFLSLFLFDLKIHHPGYITMIPVIGTMLIVWFSKEKSLIIELLSSRLIVKTGLISYSLYLWHYPIFAFFRLKDPNPQIFEKIGLFVLTFLLSIASYIIVEKPFRNNARISRKVLLVTLITGFFVVVCYSFFIIHNNGLKSRHSTLLSLYGKNEFDNRQLKMRSNSLRRQLRNKAGFKNTRLFEANHLTFSKHENIKKILIIGNSHAKNLFLIFHQNLDLFPNYEFAVFRLQIDDRDETFSSLYTSPNFLNSDIILISTDYAKNDNRDDLAALPNLIEDIQKRGKELWISSNSPKFPTYKNNTETIFDNMVKNYRKIPSLTAINKAYFTERLNYVTQVNKFVEQIAKERNVRYLDKSEFCCNKIRKSCYGVTSEGYKVYFDAEHYTLEGAKFLGEIIKEISWLEKD